MNEWVIEKTATAVNQILVIDRTNKNGTLRIVGTVTTEKVVVMQPAVIVGVDVTALDKDNAAHWTATKYDVGGTSTPAVLNVDGTAIAFPFTGTWLIAKESGAAANAFGVEYV